MAPLAAAGTLAVFHTPLGDLEVELLDASKPATVANFIRYVQSGAYTNTFIHRWEPNFVIQGGGFYTTNRNTTNASFAQIPTFPAITNEYSVGRVYRNTYGTIAMARVTGQTNSATSQWFFNLKNNPELDTADGGFTVFGRVLRGTNVLNRFLGGAASEGIYKVGGLSPPFDNLPVINQDATYEDLVYVDVSLLTAAIVRQADGARVISWQSVSNKVNRVEFTRPFPIAWTDLVSTNGTGQTMQVVDSSSDPSRLYRIRIDY